jgi:hypothetical protein
VAEQAAYSFPADYLLPISVKYGTEPIGFSDKATVDRYAEGVELLLRDNAVWYERANEEGTRKLYIYPTPAEALALELEYVYRPVALEEDADEPIEIPEEFHFHPLYYVAALYYRSVEDNPELAEVNEKTFDLKVSELIRYDNQRRSGNGVFRIGIAGITA